MSQLPDGDDLISFKGTYQFAATDKPFLLENGEQLNHGELAFETYGTLNSNKDNVILLFHALSGSQHAAGYRESVNESVDRFWADECRTGWWDKFIGPKRVIDTSKYFVICANYLGGCYGSTGPDTINPDSGKKYMGAFPFISFQDIVRSQMELIESLGLTTVFLYPEKVNKLASIASGIKLQPLQIIHNYEQIKAIESDSLFQEGNYSEKNSPQLGLELARMIGHKTYVSLSMMAERAKKNVLIQNDDNSSYSPTHQIESYFKYQASKFSQRFDANSYLKIVSAWQKFSIENKTESSAKLSPDFRALVISIDTDVCFYPDEQKELHNFFIKNHIISELHEVESDKGHDSFLLEPELYQPTLAAFLDK
jgi:homoserine O-acetyltransferase